MKLDVQIKDINEASQCYCENGKGIIEIDHYSTYHPTRLYCRLHSLSLNFNERFAQMVNHELWHLAHSPSWGFTLNAACYYLDRIMKCAIMAWFIPWVLTIFSPVFTIVTPWCFLGWAIVLIIKSPLSIIHGIEEWRDIKHTKHVDVNNGYNGINKELFDAVMAREAF
jgi:hypothetical protein